jgi:RNA polymerase sigma-B factor
MEKCSSTARVENVEAVWLIRAYREEGDYRAAERLMELHGRILNHIVWRYANHVEESQEDLLQVGYLGLVKAVNNYRLDSEAKFSSYAYSMIDGEIRHHLRDSALVKKPRWASGLYSRISEATSRLTAELGRPPLLEEIAEEVNITPQGVRELMKIFHETSVATLDDEEAPDLFSIKSLRRESFHLPVEDRILLEQAMESLSELQRSVIYLFFYYDLSQTEIGRRLGFPQRKISRIMADSLKSLRERMTHNE